MATDVLAPGADEERDDNRGSPEPQFEPRPQHHSFFAVYKKGQGYWTRMGTALGVVLLIAVFCLFVYEQIGGFAQVSKGTAAVITAIFGTGAALLAWWAMNKPRNVDFLIATDVEMHKVNWTSRQELFGSTRVVIFFLFMIAAILFLIDIGTGAFFQLIGLLKFGPLGNS